MLLLQKVADVFQLMRPRLQWLGMLRREMTVKSNLSAAPLALVAIVAMTASASAQAPTWKVQLETISGWTDPTGVVVDSTSYAVTFEELRTLSMPRCAKLDPAELARAAKNVAWLLKNVKPEEGQWESRCRDDPRVKIFIQGAEQALPLRYPLEQSCREIEPPRALRDLGKQLLELRVRSLERCRPTPAK